MKFTLKDLKFSLITGLLTGIIAYFVFTFLGVPTFGGISWRVLIILVPILWIIGVNLGYFLGRWFGPFNQFGKFCAVGFTNAAVDFGILNFLISLTGYADGIYFTLFKGCSFVVAVTQSYVWNKLWVFEADPTKNEGTRFGKFFAVNVLAAIINITVASSIVNFINPILSFDVNQWANIGAVIGSAVALLFSFIGFRLAVFRASKA